jgi:hypothetical protein
MKRLGRKSQLIAAIIAIGGLLSSLAPLIETAPPVMGKKHWSVMEVVATTCETGLPGGKGMTGLAGASIMVFAYFLLAVALAVICVFPDGRIIISIGIFGLIVSAESFRDGPGLRQLFYGALGSLSGSVRYTELPWILIAVMLTLTIVSSSEGVPAQASHLEDTPSPDAPRESGS